MDECRLPPVHMMRLRKDEVAMSLLCLITTVQLPCDIAPQNVCVECFYPADRATEEVARRFATAAAVA